MLENLFGLGGYLGPPAELQPTSEAKPANYVDGWLAALKDPKTQAMLLGVGTQLMAPRWNPGSALPDAINSGAQAVAAQQSHEDQQAQLAAENDLKNRTLAQRAAESQADNATRLEAARIGADSRADVAEIRAATALDRMQQRQTASQRAAQGRYEQQYVNTQLKAWQGGNLLKEPTPELMRRWQAEARQNWLQLYDNPADAGAPGAPGAMPGNGAGTSRNPANGPSPAPLPKPGTAPAGTSENSGNAPRRATVQELKDKTSAAKWEEWMNDPVKRRQLEEILAPGEILPPMRRRGAYPSRAVQEAK